jgi:threonine synthase
MTEAAFQRCIQTGCRATAALDDTSFQCPKCGSLMDVAYDWDRVRPPKSLNEFEAKWARQPVWMQR